MRKLNIKISKITLAIITIAIIAFIPHISHANVADSIIGGFAIGAINNLLAYIANWVLGLVSVALTVSGIFLNLAMNITTHISSIYNFDTPSGITAVWITIRDLSSIFIIFALLYYSIMTILGLGGGNLNRLIVNIFLAGILINFSLFFVRVAVDASNLISLQFYEAIAPNTSQNLTVSNAFSGGGLTNVFMQHLKIPKIYNSSGIFSSGGAVDVAAGIGFMAVGGIALMVTAAVSFFAAAVAITARTAIILFIMAVSPLYFAGMIFPQVKKAVSDKIMKMLVDQCLFLPIYLFLLYVSLRIISSDAFTGVLGREPTTTAAGSSPFGPVFIIIIIQYVIALIFINMPLIIAISFGGKGMSWAKDRMVTPGKLGGMFGGFLGRNVLGGIGTLGKKATESVTTGAQESSFGRGVASTLRTFGLKGENVKAGFESMEKAKYGGSTSRADEIKAGKERTKYLQGKLRENERGAELENALTASVPFTELKKITSKMSSKDIENAKKKLSDPKFAAALSSKQVENIMKSSEISDKEKDDLKKSRTEGLKLAITSIGSGDFENILKEDFSEEQKDNLKKARGEALQTAINSGTNNVKEYMKNLSGKELVKMDKVLLTNQSVMDNYTISQLKDMESNNLGRDIKQAIAGYIDSLRADTQHNAYSWMMANDEKILNAWLT